MKLFNSPPKTDAKSEGARGMGDPDVPGELAAVALPDVQVAPIAIGASGATGTGGMAGRLKVDASYRIESLLMVVGWCTQADFPLELHADGQPLATRRVSVDRPDVAQSLNIAGGRELGFVLVAEVKGAGDFSVSWPSAHGNEEHSKPLTLMPAPAPGASEQLALGRAFGLMAFTVPRFSPKWLDLIAKVSVSAMPCRDAKGFLEFGAACELTKDAVIVGWEAHTDISTVWLEDEQGKVHPLDKAYRRFRQDVHDAIAHEFAHGSRDAGFAIRLQGLKPGARIQLKALSETGVHILSETQCSTLSAEPVAAARWLFGIGIPVAELHQRLPIIDAPVLEPLLEYRQRRWNELPVRTKQLGPRPDEPLVSVVIPLYGRIDFVEHQLIEFTADSWFSRHAELIYVLDDPRIVDSFSEQAETLHRLYKVSFRWVWGNTNRGFSGANNLGATFATAPHLVFLNSDAFPQKPGWLEALIDVLNQHPDIGAVGPRLVFADGSVQHSGMEFRRRDELGIWVNHHPGMGLAPSLDPHKGLTRVPAVTGACIALRRADLDRVGGWDTGYLIGDFEDSDLCLKLRSEGQTIAYLPTVQLTHLERQSFKLLGQDEFRTRVVIYNAVRHQERWAKLLAEDANAQAISNATEAAAS